MLFVSSHDKSSIYCLNLDKVEDSRTVFRGSKDGAKRAHLLGVTRDHMLIVEDDTLAARPMTCLGGAPAAAAFTRALIPQVEVYLDRILITDTEVFITHNDALYFMDLTSAAPPAPILFYSRTEADPRVFTLLDTDKTAMYELTQSARNPRLTRCVLPMRTQKLRLRLPKEEPLLPELWALVAEYAQTLPLVGYVPCSSLANLDVTAMIMLPCGLFLVGSDMEHWATNQLDNFWLSLFDARTDTLTRLRNTDHLRVSRPTGFTLDVVGRIVYVADSRNMEVREIHLDPSLFLFPKP
jgi:hypothetical protein